ncbi:MAG TPA: hypothetical protein VI895_03160 [Bdellovibrionota bacterium]|nr:hypothetical protein [Bdellovibrionota bacterium]
MKSVLGMLFFLFVGFVLQTTALPHFFLMLAKSTGLSFLGGHTIHLSLLLLLHLSFSRDFSGSLSWGVTVGVMATWFGLAWPGATLASFFLMSVFGFLLSRRIVLEGSVGGFLLTAGLVFFYGVFHTWALKIFHHVSVPLATQGLTILIQTVLDSLAAPILYWMLAAFDRRAMGEDHRTGTSILLPTAGW